MITPYQIPQRLDNPLYMSDLVLSYSTTTRLIVGVGSCNDTTGDVDFIVNTPITVNINTVGVNGLDRPLTNNTMYGVYLIGDPLGRYPNGVILSPVATTSGLSNTSLKLPSGYKSYRLRSYIFVGAGVIQKFTMVGTSNSFQMFYAANILVLGSSSSASFAPVSLYGYVPPRNALVYFGTNMTVTIDGAATLFRPAGSTSATPFRVSCALTGTQDFNNMSAMARYDSGTNRFGIEYQTTTGASIALVVVGYDTTVL